MNPHPIATTRGSRTAHLAPTMRRERTSRPSTSVPRRWPSPGDATPARGFGGGEERNRRESRARAKADASSWCDCDVDGRVLSFMSGSPDRGGVAHFSRVNSLLLCGLVQASGSRSIGHSRDRLANEPRCRVGHAVRLSQRPGMR